MIKKVHDFGYKKLLSNKKIFEQLLKSFVKEDFINYIDFNELETLDKSFISEQYKETESDLIYKTKIKGQESYIYVLVEFQSSVDKFMPLRIVNYISNFYMGLIESYEKEKKQIKKLPPIFPIMIYNGDDNWNYSNSFNDLIENNQLLGDYAINFKYFKIIEKDYSKEDLLKVKNIISTVFLTECHYNFDQMSTEIASLIDTQDQESVKVFLNWLRMLSENDIINKDDYDNFEDIYQNKLEVKNMFANSFQKEKDRLILLGKSEGEQIGLEKGELSKAKSLLIKLLVKKFKNISQNLTDKINNSNDLKLIENTIENIFDLNSINDIDNLF